jgi:hypothetical protein
MAPAYANRTAVARIGAARAIRSNAAAQGRPEIDVGIVGQRAGVSGC